MDDAPARDDAPPDDATSHDEPAPGDLVAERYRVVRPLAHGAMGEVFLAEHEGLHRQVALKFLHASLVGNAEVAARFAREAVAAARLEHPNVIAVYDSGTDARGRFFLAMEYCDGDELRELVARGPLEPARALDIARQVAAALDHAHAEGVVHRDVKPENVLVLRRDGAVKVIDFGIAKVYEPTGEGSATGGALTRAGFVLGTPEYMAPEQALGGAVDHRADLYAFAVVVYEALTGRRPFDGDDVLALLMKHVHAPPPPPSSFAPALSPAVDAVFAKALSKSPADRYDTAGAFTTALARALESPADASSVAVAPTERPPPADASLAPVAVVARRTLTRARAVWDAAPSRARYVVAAAALVALVAVLARGGASRAPAASSTLRAATGAARVPGARPTASGDALTALRARVEALRNRPDLPTGTTRERHATALALEAMRLEAPDDAAVAYALGALYARDRATVNQAVNAYRDALRVVPALASDEDLVRDVARIWATTVSRSAPAEALLRGPLAAASLDALVEAAGDRPGGNARVAALLAEEPFASRLDATQRAIVSLASARTCEQRRAAVEALGRDGDARALAALRRVRTGRGCGFMGLEACNGCLREALPAAVAAVEARVSPR